MCSCRYYKSEHNPDVERQYVAVKKVARKDEDHFASLLDNELDILHRANQAGVTRIVKHAELGISVYKDWCLVME